MTQKNIKIADRLLYSVALASLFIVLLVGYGFKDADARPRVFSGGHLADRIITVDYAHHETHVSNHYCSVFNDTLGTGDAITLLINTPALPSRVHMLIVARGSSEGRYQVYMNPTVSALGGTLEVGNHDMGSSKTSGVFITNTPTISSIGTEVEALERHFGAGQQGGGESRAFNEIILPASALVLINGVSESNNNDFTINIDFYVDDGDAP